MGKRLLSWAIAAAMVLGLGLSPPSPTPARAAGATGPVVTANGDGTYDVTFSFEYSGSEKVTVRGDMNDWGEEDVMTKQDGNVYSHTFKGLPVGTYAYKFVVGENGWNQDPNNIFSASGDGNSFVAVGYESPVIDGTSVTIKYINKNAKLKTIQYAGSMTGWASEDMTDNGDGVFTCTFDTLDIEKLYEYKFVVEDKWVADPANPFDLFGGSKNSQFTIPEPPKGESITLTYEGEASSVEVRGTFPGMSWKDGLKMTSDGHNKWTLTLDGLKAGPRRARGPR